MGKTFTHLSNPTVKKSYPVTPSPQLIPNGYAQGTGYLKDIEHKHLMTLYQKYNTHRY
jgi:hypothetical protein